MNNMGERIKEMLEKQNMRQKELAERVGCTEAAISHYIKGDRVPRAIVITNIASALKTTAEYLVSGENNGEEIVQIERLLARNANKMSMEDKMRIIKILTGGENV